MDASWSRRSLLVTELSRPARKMADPQHGSPVTARDMAVALATSRSYRAGRRNRGNDKPGQRDQMARTIAPPRRPATGCADAPGSRPR